MSDSGQTGVHQGRSVNDLMAEYTDSLQKENAELQERIERLRFAIWYTVNNSTIRNNYPAECAVMEDALIASR